VDAASARRPDDPGLLYDRARYLRRSDRPEEALPIMARIKATDAPEGVRETLFKERRLYMSRMLRSGQTRLAYNVAADHGLSSGEFFADSEWMAGWIALRFTKDYAAAEKHFARLGENVGTPVSKSRAHYWRALALKSLGRGAEAQAQLAEGAKLNFTFYGQLAAAGLDAKPLMSLGDPPIITAEARNAFESREIVRVLRLMAQAGDRQDFESIAFFLDDQLETAADHELLAELARLSAYTRTAVRSAKAGLRRGIVAPKAAYPLLDIPAAARQPGRPEPALVNAITRQESEFDTQAVSSAGARGLTEMCVRVCRRRSACT
jgi:soluble lytic murein transglycosylase